MIAWGNLYLALAGAECNLKEVLTSDQVDLIALRRLEFKKQLNLYRTAMLKRRKEKRLGNTLSFVEHIFIKKLKAIESRAKYLY